MQILLSESSDIGEMVIRARSDDKLFAALVKDQTKHIKYAAYQAVGHFVTESDDEWSTALIAFYEAVQKYDPGRGGFLRFADLVIKRRLLDDARKSMGKSVEVPLSDIDCEIEDTAEHVLPDLQYEIETFSRQMEPYNITFSDLAKVSPKAGKTRRLCAAAIRCVTQDPALAAKMRRTNSLPAREIQLSAGVPRKILERHRKYIIAASEIILSDLPCMQQFVKTIREEGNYEGSSNGIE